MRVKEEEETYELKDEETKRLKRMNVQSIIENLKGAFRSEILQVTIKNQKRVIITINPDSLINVASLLYHEEGCRFIIASALHTKKGFEIHYHFSKDSIGLIINIHVILDKENPQIESLSNMMDAANWIEREMHELFGINFLNHPNQEKLISDGNWAEGVYPLRKEFK
jgi:NADH-quinone oxidoreductase subunit C